MGTFFAADGVICMLAMFWIFAMCGRSNTDALRTVERVRAMERAADARDRKAAQKLADTEAKRELRERWEAEQRANAQAEPTPEPTAFRVPVIVHAPVTRAKVEPPPVAKPKVHRPAKRTATVTPPEPVIVPEPEPTPEPERVAPPAKVERPKAAPVSRPPAKVARRKASTTFDPSPVKARKGCPTHPFGSGYCSACAAVNAA